MTIAITGHGMMPNKRLHNQPGYNNIVRRQLIEEAVR